MNYLETICINNHEVLNFEYHIARMRKNSIAELPNISTLNKLDGRVKCRIVYNYTDIISIDFLPYKLPIIKSLRVIESNSIIYDKKYEDRSALSALYAERDDCNDIIICSDGNIRDSYFCNLVFSLQGELFTPDTPLLSGTKRQKLIDCGIITPCKITRNDISKYDGLYLINAMIDLDDDIFIPITDINND